MDRLTMTSDKGGLAFTFNLDVTCKRSEMDKIVALGERLKSYEDAEEQSLLIRLPCKVGDDIYWINDEEKCVSVHKNGIRGIVVRNGEFAIEDTDGYIDVAGTKYCYLTREEAERALKGGE
mgnify:CR=1 FL=1